MTCPPFNCVGCGHPACDDGGFVHGQADPHACSRCSCAAYVYPPGVEESEFEGGGGQSGGGGSSGSW
jgi:uncharacterized membrane protein YgcG